ncbi:hypothetical protein LINGRAHAP2_LOCUS16637 [Linum grandiflorum]
MGNCINVMICPRAEKSTVLVSKEEDKEFSRKISYDGRRQGSKVADHPVLSYKSLLAGAKLEQGKVKVVLTRQQLDFVLKNAKELRSKGIVVRVPQSYKESSSRKWQPSLTTIREVKSF